MEPIKTALLSFGMSGRLFHAPFLHLDPGYELYSVWEREKDLAAAVYPGIRTVRSLDALLADDSVELVIINTPNYTHFKYARKALLAGKHVVVEKPFAVTLEEALELTQLAEDQGRQLSVYQNRRYDSDFKTVKKVLAERLLGEVAEAELHFDRFNEALSPKLHKEIPGPGTGLLHDLGPHLIDQALQLFGDPEAVFADLRIQRPISQVGDYMEILLYYPSFPVRLKAGYLVREALPAYIIHGTKGSFLKSRADVQEKDLQAGKQPTGPEWGVEPESERGLLHTDTRGYIPSLNGDYRAYYTALYGAIREGQPLPVTPEEGIRVMRVIDAAIRSSAEKRVIPF